MIPRYVRSTDVVQRHSAECLLLLPVRGDSEPVVVGGSGGLVWALLSEPITLRELSRVLSDATGASPATVEADVEPLVRGLVERGVVVEVS